MPTTLEKEKPVKSAMTEESLFTFLKEKIQSGGYPGGMRLPTERALADEFGVGRAAVRNALFSLATQGMIERKPGSRPLVSGQPQIDRSGAKFGQPKTAVQSIAVILPHHPIYLTAMCVLSGIHEAMRQKESPHRLVILDTNGPTWEATTQAEMRALRTLDDHDIAGAILWHSGGEVTLPRIRQLHEQRYPFVFVDRCPPDLSCDYVGTDNRTAARDAVNHLLRLGHQRIGHLTSTARINTLLDRADGYRDALRTFGLPARPELIYQIPSDLRSSVEEALEYFFSLPEPPTALFCMNDLIAHHVVAILEASGRRIPDDLSVVGCDDLERFTPRPALLTTLRQPFEDVGQRAADLLLNRLSAPDPSKAPYQHVLLPAPLVVRSTCKRL